MATLIPLLYYTKPKNSLKIIIIIFNCYLLLNYSYKNNKSKSIFAFYSLKALINIGYY